jgi:hypothetical protein
MFFTFGPNLHRVVAAAAGLSEFSQCRVFLAVTVAVTESGPALTQLAG